MFLLSWIGSGIVAALIMRMLIRVLQDRWTNGDRLICFAMIPLGYFSLLLALIHTIVSAEDIFDDILSWPRIQKAWDWLNEDISEK